MAFDMGWNFRGSSGFVTDQTFAVPGLAEAYPHTYTNGLGNSINAGWTGGSSMAGANRTTGNDARLCGINYANSNTTNAFQVDLSSGSAPGAGTYTVDLAAGDNAAFHIYTAIDVKDNTTVVIGPFSGSSGGADMYIDATGAVDSPGTASWDLVSHTASKTFTTTTVVMDINSTSDNPVVVHFRLTLAGGAPAVIPDILMAPRLPA